MNCDFSHNGRLVVSASDVDNIIRIWDSHTGCLVQELRGKTKRMLQLNFNIASYYIQPCDLKTKVLVLEITRVQFVKVFLLVSRPLRKRKQVRIPVQTTNQFIFDT